MGFLSSSCSFTRFRIVDEISRDFWQTVPEKLKQFAFHDIDNIPEMRSFGWVSFDDMLDSEWLTASPYKGNYLIFSFRLDTRRIPAGVIKKHFNLALKAEKERIAQQNKNFISRERKKEIKEQVLLTLRQRFLPVPAEFNVLWNLDGNSVWLASTQTSVIDLFLDHFTSTFELDLEPLSPLNLAKTMLNEEGLARLDHLEATQFVASAQY
ncbi:MAG: recombination-associated protein RdgC [Desulfovibrionaceae bacterium]|nr:recombination-associated protein RdgC [Desulfovibrionaceae bacterium]